MTKDKIWNITYEVKCAEDNEYVKLTWEIKTSKCEDGSYIVMDATYPDNELYHAYGFTEKEAISSLVKKQIIDIIDGPIIECGQLSCFSKKWETNLKWKYN